MNKIRLGCKILTTVIIGVFVWGCSVTLPNPDYLGGGAARGPGTYDHRVNSLVIQDTETGIKLTWSNPMHWRFEGVLVARLDATITSTITGDSISSSSISLVQNVWGPADGYAYSVGQLGNPNALILDAGDITTYNDDSLEADAAYYYVLYTYTKKYKYSFGYSVNTLSYSSNPFVHFD
jgi:hypothetical protein